MNTNGLLGRKVPHEGSRSNRSSLVSLIIGLVVGFCLALLFMLSTSQQPEWMLHADHQYGNINYTSNTHDLLDETGPEHDVGMHQHTYENNSIAAKLYEEIRVLCWVMTNPTNHQKKAIHVKRTWGKRCNKLIFMSSAEDAELESIALPVKEGRNNLWAKTKEAYKYLYKHHLNDADWFFKADDDTYTIVENLRYFLYPYSPKTPIYFGFKFKPYVKQGYMSGGAGYVLSKEAVRRFVETGLTNPKICQSNGTGNEDVEIGKCLANVKVIAADSRDPHGRGRFFPFRPESSLFPSHKKNFWFWRYIYYKYKEGLDCCSDNAVTFHYISPNQMYVLDYFIYHLQPYGIINLPQPLPER